MPRPRRTAPGGFVYHVLNRANSRRRIFDSAGDYQAFERILGEVAARVPMRVLAWCLMPNHWHLVLWPKEDGHLSDYMRLVTLTHTQRWHSHRGTAGTGQLYQGRFKSFVVQDSAHFLTVCRYVEANALRARLVKRAEEWRWSSLSRRQSGDQDGEPWPVPRPSTWLAFVNEVPSPGEVTTIRTSAQRGAPLGDPNWVASMASLLSLQSSLRKRGRPARAEAGIEKGPDPF
jgi:putative transposase